MKVFGYNSMNIAIRGAPPDFKNISICQLGLSVPFASTGCVM